MKNTPNAITWRGVTYAMGARVRCPYGEATIARLYAPTANEDRPRAMLDRGEGVDVRLRSLIVTLDKLELL